MSYSEIGVLNGIRTLHDPLERCSLLFPSQYLRLSFPIDENHSHSHEMTNGYWGRPCTSGVAKSGKKQLYRSCTSYISIEPYINVLQSDRVCMNSGNKGISYLNFSKYGI